MVSASPWNLPVLTFCLPNGALAIQEAEVKLKRSYVPKLEKALPEMKVARYIQIENKIRAIVNYELAAEIPLVE